MQENHEEEAFPLRDATDLLILMHRDAHFGGNFEEMLQYYTREGKGVYPDIEVSRIQELIEMERTLKQDLAALFLSGSDSEKIARSRLMYQELRSLYENQKPEFKTARLIADLILSEDPEAEAEIEALVKEKSSILPALIQLIQSEDLHDPLFPGYGLSPNLAIKALGQIGDKRAIITLFESLDSGDFFDDNLALDALKAIGEPAKSFLLKVLHGKPITEDNEKAAIALLAFKEDPQVAKEAFTLFQELHVRQDPVLATYLALICDGLSEEKDRTAFKALVSDPATPKALRRDMESVAKQWESQNSR
jgi:hypothetical protein